MKYLTEAPLKLLNALLIRTLKRKFLTAPELAQIEKSVNETQDKDVRLVGEYFLFIAFIRLRHFDAIRFKIAEHAVNNERVIMETQETKKITNLYINDKIRLFMEFVDANYIKLKRICSLPIFC